MSKTTFDSVVYAGLFLTDESKAILKNHFKMEGWRDINATIYCDHVTLAFKPFNTYLNVLHGYLGKEYDINPKRYIRDDRAACVTVRSELTRDLFLGRSMHITLATFQSRSFAGQTSPVYSNELIFLDKFNDPSIESAYNVGECPELKGVVGVHTASMGVVTDPNMLLKGTIESIGNIS